MGTFADLLAQVGAGGNTALPGTAGNVSPYDAATYGITSTYAATPVNWSITSKPVPATAPPDLRPHEPDTVIPADSTVPGPSTQKTTIIDALNKLYVLNETDLMQLQKDLLAGGFYSQSYYGRRPHQIQYGVVQPDTIAAFKNALDYTVHTEQSNPSVTVQQIINAAVQDRAKGGQGALAAPLPVHVDLTNPETLAAFFQDTATKETGQRLSPGQINSMVTAFQALQSQAQTQQQQDQLTGAGGTTTAAPDPTAFAQSQLNQTEGPAVAGTRMAGVADVMLNMIQHGITAGAAAGGVAGT